MWNLRNVGWASNTIEPGVGPYPWVLTFLGIVLLAGCRTPVSRVECEQLQTVANKTLDQVMAVYEGGSATYSADNERLVAILYSEGSQALYEPEIGHPQLKSVQDELVAAFQKAADIRYEASELVPADPNTLPSPAAAQQIAELQMQSEADIPPTLQALSQMCGGS
ncbi:MAG: hypothetical protein AAFR42_02565 [Cyanobacteria bacterium J06628_6]